MANPRYNPLLTLDDGSCQGLTYGWVGRQRVYTVQEYCGQTSLRRPTLVISHRKPLNYDIYLQRQLFARTALSHQKQLNVSTGYKIVCGFLRLMVF